jgi:hypothetical protein
MKTLTIEYKNWRNETRIREILPIQIWFGHTRYHTENQWLLNAYDIEDCDKVKDFAVKDIIRFL